MDIGGIGSVGGAFSGMNGAGEMQRHAPSGFAGRLAGHMIDEQDTDGDGSLSLEETELSEETFGRIDGDGDGYITSAEIKNGLMDRAEQFRMQHMGENSEMQRPQGPPPDSQGPGAHRGQMSSLMSSIFEDDDDGFSSLNQDSGSLSVTV